MLVESCKKLLLMLDLKLKPGDAVDHCRWKAEIKGIGV